MAHWTDRKKVLLIFQQKNEISADYYLFLLILVRSIHRKGLYSKELNVTIEGLFRAGTYFALGLQYPGMSLTFSLE
jgi:hypothetical protein